MSQIFVCVIKREKHTIPPAFLEQIAQLASRSDMYVFCPPKYIEEFMRTPKYGNLLVFDLADNDEYDDCEEFYYTVDCDLQNKRIETMVHIANYVLSCGYPLEFFMGLSGKCSAFDQFILLLLVLIMSSSLAPTCVPPVQAGLWLSGWMQPLIMLLITRIPSSSFPADKAPMNLAPKQMP